MISAIVKVLYDSSRLAFSAQYGTAGIDLTPIPVMSERGRWYGVGGSASYPGSFDLPDRGYVFARGAPFTIPTVLFNPVIPIRCK